MATSSARPAGARSRCSRSILIPAAAVLALFGALLAVAADRTPHGSSPASTSTAVAGSGSGPASRSALTVRSITGATVRVPDGKPTVLFFFTGACSSCYIGAKNLASVLTDTGSRADVIAVGLDPTEPVDAIKQFLSAVGNPPFTLVRDDGTLLRVFNVATLGTTIVLDAAGRLIFRGIDPAIDQIRRALTTPGVI
jgi:cytochrome oxidase Cu insertion factor (SCO1/SenC/PrrC family)